MKPFGNDLKVVAGPKNLLDTISQCPGATIPSADATRSLQTHSTKWSCFLTIQIDTLRRSSNVHTRKSVPQNITDFLAWLHLLCTMRLRDGTLAAQGGCVARLPTTFPSRFRIATFEIPETLSIGDFFALDLCAVDFRAILVGHAQKFRDSDLGQ